MSSIHCTITSVALSVLFLAGAANAAPASKADNATAVRAAAASPMSAQALETLYSGRTWKWKSGGGFFAAEPRHFAGWSQKGDVWSYGEGRWYATNAGKLCMEALWFDRSGNGGNVSCFLHREKDGVIYQKPSLGGSWYVFSHSPVQPKDEIRKLVRGDSVSAGLERLKTERRR